MLDKNQIKNIPRVSVAMEILNKRKKNNKNDGNLCLLYN